jgi:hypothetical protein
MKKRLPDARCALCEYPFSAVGGKRITETASRGVRVVGTGQTIDCLPARPLTLLPVAKKDSQLRLALWGDWSPEATRRAVSAAESDETPRRNGVKSCGPVAQIRS